MKTLHIAPGDSAAGCMRQALHSAGRDERVLAFSDDLSCGPINPDDAASRAAWWNTWMEWPELEAHYVSFWSTVDESKDKLVVWFGRHAARELAFRLAWAAHMKTRPYQVVDITGLRFPTKDRNGADKITDPAKSVSLMNTVQLAAQVGNEQPVTAEDNLGLLQTWERLKQENAPFRIVTPAGLASAPVTYFDNVLLEQAGPDWRKVAHVIGHAMAATFEPYYQVGDMALHQRIVALVEAGELEAEGDPYDVRTCRIRRN